MVDILDVLHQYVPKTTTTQTYDTCAEDGSTRTTEVHIDHINPILIGGDQLTVARVRGSQDALLNSESGTQRVQGLLPVIEDWHAKICYMQVLPMLIMFLIPDKTLDCTHGNVPT